MNNLYDALEICLQEIENGADLETVLFRYPELAEELRPILETAIQAKSSAAAGPSAEAVRRGRAKVLQQAAHLRAGRARSSRRLWTVPLRRVLVSLAMILALFVSGTGLVRAASTTLPGDNLYPVKRTWEDVRLLLTFDAQLREMLKVERENERHKEVRKLFAEGRSEEVDFSGIVTRQTGALWIVSGVPVVISPQTELRDGQVQVEDAIRVRGFTQADGSVLAERVDILDEGMPLPELDEDDFREFEREDNGSDNEAGEDHSGSGSRKGSSRRGENDNNSGSNSGNQNDNQNNDDDSDENSNEDDNSSSNDNDDDNSGEDGSGGDDNSDNGRDESEDDD